MKNLIRCVVVALFCTKGLLAFSQTPLFNSYPSASAVIFLDFDGQTVSGTSWNSYGPIYCGASGLNATQMTEVFNRIAEDYRPFNINITTDSTKYFAAPANKRMRVILTVTSDWYGQAGGVSFINSFTWGDNTPCFVFTALLNYNTKNIAEAASHEAGHTLGLYHQSTYDANCVKTAEYNAGNGSGEIGWAPIMGVGYYRNLTLWHNGQSSNDCNSYQNDLDIITSATNGITYRTDDYGNSFNASTTATFANNIFNINGVIERNTDQDMFQFTTSTPARFKLNGTPYNVGTGDVGSDLDMQITLFNSSQTALGTYNPGLYLNSIIDTTLDAGNYYLMVEGKGNMYAPNYASLGSYSLQGQLFPVTLPVHRLELSGRADKDKHILNWIIQADEQVIQQVLEISVDGIHFTPFIQPANASRNYTYVINNRGNKWYRLKVAFDNNLSYYSNVIIIRQSDETGMPKLINSLVTNKISVSSPGNFDYMLIDMNGKILKKSKLSNGNNIINADGLLSGMYIIRFTNGDQQWTEKLVKQ